MNRYYYDLHLHSSLSPCGDNDNTPNNIAGMATLCGLNIIALTDHNTTKNCPAFFEAANRYGLIPIAGMELTSSEDIHVVCLFEELDDAMRFNDYVDSHRVKIKNKPEIFGDQFILDGEDNCVGIEEYLLSNATKISITEVTSIVTEYGGVAYPAHIDRMSNGIIATLGTLPEDIHFTAVEFHNKDCIEEYKAKYPICNKTVVISSDAHYLTDIREGENYFELADEPYSRSKVRKELFRILRGEL